ncbi:hypothetical protein KSS87_018842 [Heliosperma pusillum]|nr:hypothetical protein KSS87_000811 [Heliosperma pusillum]KAH9619823.1 hypothetical protein KSS87_018842 [Heliosperma pusillum]
MEMEMGNIGRINEGNKNGEGEIETTVDWRGRPSNPSKHGGMRAAFFVLGLQGFEIMAIAAVGNNLITYVINEMHYPLSKAANIVTNFIGTIFLLSLFGGYLSDSYLGCFWTILFFGFVELSGFILLSVQAHLPQLKPPQCNMLLQETTGQICEEAKGIKSLIFFMALYLVALGSGCVKPNMIAHGGDQFNPKQSKQLSTYFNAAYLAFSIGELIALTVLVWIQTHSGMDIGFGISAAVMAMGLISLVAGTLVYKNKRPRGSIFTPIAQLVILEKLLWDRGSRFVYEPTIDSKFLDKASIKIQQSPTNKPESPWTLCTTTQVEQVKILISVLPIFTCTIIFNTILAQLQTFSVQQASQMKTRLTDSFTIPPASLQSIPYLMLLVVVPLYDKLLVPFLRRFTGHASGITALQRVGAGLFLATASMIAAAITERHRRAAALEHGNVLSVFYITPQFLIFGFAEMLTAVGMIEFFYKQSVSGMQSFLTAMTYCSYSLGFYLSSVLVEVINRATSTTTTGKKGWLGDNDLNKDRLDLFYWLLAGLSLLNFFQYLFWASWYSYNPSVMVASQQHVSPENGDVDGDGDGDVRYRP